MMDFFNCSPHPYLFFNKDKDTVTFVGFMVTKRGDLIDPASKKVIKSAIMSSQLYTGLVANRVNFNDDYRCWTPEIMREKISRVMGVDNEQGDPDNTYVLTVDNVIKILAIQMRFRYYDFVQSLVNFSNHLDHVFM